ncbi:MAG: peptidylprolyl isomerase [Acetatifactor sp.]|nr:peptidylprolyl isomerase [Acetatifactor sp.]
MKKKLCTILAICLATAAVLAGCGGQGQGSDPVPGGQSQGGEDAAGQQETSQPAAQEDELLSGKHHVKINMKDLGTIEVELDADQAPITVTNFVNLAKNGFYDGLTFHRIMEGFMMQGGDPWGNGFGGSDQEIKGEFSLNGVDNTLSHTRGAISMARSNNPDSASSQFFIMHQDGTFLDGQYACFGYVTSGMEIVDEICENAVVIDDNGTVPAENQPVIESIEVVD